MTFVFTGSNRFLARNALEQVVADFTERHGEMSIERFDATDVEYSVIAGSLDAISMFAPKKLVVVTDVSKNADIASRLSELVGKTSEDAQLIIVENGLDKRSVYYKAVKKLPGFREFNELDENGLIQWVMEHAEQKDAQISSNDARYLVQRIGLNQERLDRELEKLCGYDVVITRQNIDLLTQASPRSTIFNLVETAFAGDARAAFALYEDQRVQRVEPQAIFGMLVWQMHIVAICASDLQKTSAMLATETGLNPYVLGKAQNIARRMGSRAKVAGFLTYLRDIEYASKHQSFNFDDAIRFLLLKLSY